MQGVDVTRAIVEAYPQQSEPIQLALIPILGRKQNALAAPILKAAAESNMAAVRMAGLLALADSGQPEGADIVLKAAQEGSGEISTAARQALMKFAANLRTGGHNAEAGKIYAEAFRLTLDQKDQCREVAEGIIMCPVAEAYDAAKIAPAREEIKDLSTRMLMAVAGALTAAKQNDKALELYELVRKSNPPAELVAELARGMSAAGAKIDVQGLLGTITEWNVVGPFELGAQNAGWNTDYIGETNPSLAGRYMSGKTRVAWKAVKSKDASGKIDLRKNVANQDSAIGYALAQVDVKEATDALLLLGVDDCEKVWINGQQAFELFVARGLQCDQDRIKIKLKAGTNTILLKIWQQTLGWEFCARLTLPDGRPLAFTQPKQ
jgi:hypothetical protein